MKEKMMLIFITGTDTHLGLRSNALTTAFSKLFQYTLLQIFYSAHKIQTTLHFERKEDEVHCNAHDPQEPYSCGLWEVPWTSVKFLNVFFFFFSCNTVDIPKILVTYNLSLRLSIHWPHFWDSWAAHSTASLPPCCRKISMSSPFDRVEVTDFLVGCTMISLETRTARTAKLVLKS